MAASRNLGFCQKWNMTTAKVASDLYALVYQIWLRYVKSGRVTAIYVFKMAAGHHLGFCRSEHWKHFCFWDVCFCLWTKFRVNVMTIKVNFKNGGRRHLGFGRSEIWRQGKSPLTRIYLHSKIGEDTLKGVQVMAIYVFSKWRLTAILDLHRSEIWRYLCSQDVGFSLWAKFCVNTCNSDWVIAIK